MIISVRILEPIGIFKTFVRGQGVLFRGQSDDEFIPVRVYRREFPVGIISEVISDGDGLCCALTRMGTSMHAEVLPLRNQSGGFMNKLVSRLVQQADFEGCHDFDSCPNLTLKELNGPLPPVPHPKSSELERLLDLSVDDQLLDDS